jgi:hypothetical protein
MTQAPTRRDVAGSMPRRVIRLHHRRVMRGCDRSWGEV